MVQDMTHCIYCIPAATACDAAECKAPANGHHDMCDVPSFDMCASCAGTEAAAESRALAFN